MQMFFLQREYGITPQRYGYREVSEYSGRTKYRTDNKQCPGTRDFPVREDIIVDYYAATLEMLLEKCFFAKEQLSKEEALQTVDFLLNSSIYMFFKV